MEEPIAQKKSSSPWLLILSLVLAAGLLYLALRKVDWAELAITLRQGNPGLLLLSIGILSLSCLVRALRWRVLLSAAPDLPPGARLSLLSVFWAVMTGYLGNAYLPARAGEVVRSVMIGQKCGISKSFSLATALTERIVDAIILVTVSALALSAMPALPAEFAGAMKAMGAVGLIGAVLVFIAPRARTWVDWLINRLPLVPAGIRQKLAGMAGQFLLGAGALQDWSRLGQFLLYSILIWSLDTINGLTVAAAFGLSLNPLQVFILLAALGLASALPSTPGYVGIFQFVAINILVPFGLTEAQALAYILAFQGVQYLAITAWGLTGLWMLRKTIRT